MTHKTQRSEEETDKAVCKSAEREISPEDWDEVWVLVMDQKSAPGGRNWFMRWTPGIGPMGTWEEAEAASFPSEQAAMQSPAFSFPLTFYKPERIAP